MTTAATTGRAARGVRSTPADKHDERRVQLAESALTTLGELGYARASLREIAANSAFSHGVVHYYFRDKLELIIFCVRHYKARCVTRYDDVVADSTSADELLDAFADKLVETLRDEAPMHRLWYDLRTQSMFEQPLREAVTMIDRTLQDMIWRVVERYAALAGRSVAMTPAAAYGVLDGLFQQALLAHLIGAPDDATGSTPLDGIAAQVHALMPLMLVPDDGGARPITPAAASPRPARPRRPAPA